MGFAIGGRRDRGREKVFELVDAARCRDVLVRRDARNGRLVHRDCVGNRLEIERPQMLDAVHEESVLLAHDLLGDFENRAGALIQAFHEPIRSLQTIEQIALVALVRRRFGDARVIGAIDEDARQRVAIQLDVPAAVRCGADDDVRHDGLHLHGAEFQTWLRIEALDLADHVGEFVHIDADGLFQGREIAIGQMIEIGQQLRHQWIVAILILELQSQAFGERTGENSGRIERLQFAEDALDQFQRRAEPLRERFEIRRDVAGFVDEIDQVLADEALDRVA